MPAEPGKPSEFEGRILFEISCEEPWHLICESFSDEGGGFRQLAELLFDLSARGWLEINQYADGGPVPTVEVLAAHAAANNGYLDGEWPQDFSWSLSCTEMALDLLVAEGKLVSLVPSENGAA